MSREFESFSFIAKFGFTMELVYTTNKNVPRKLSSLCMQTILEENPQELIPFWKVFKHVIRQLVFYTTVIPDHDSNNQTANFCFLLCYGFRNVVKNVQESWFPTFDSLKIQMFQTRRRMFPFVFPVDATLLRHSLEQISLRN